VCTEGEQIEECDDSASPYDESPSENGDSEVDTNYSLCYDSYSDSSDSNSSTLYEISVCALNETQNEDLTVERENRKPKAEKREPFEQNGKEMKPNCYEMQGTHTEFLKKLLKYLNKSYVPCGTSCRKKCFPKSSDQKTLDISKDIGLWRYQCEEKLHISFSEVTCTKIQIAAVREAVNSNCSGAFSLEKRHLNSGECSELCSYC